MNLGMKFDQILDGNEHRRSGRGVPVVFAQVERQSRSADLRLQGKSRLESLLPVRAETQKFHVELLRLVHGEDSKNRDR